MRTRIALITGLLLATLLAAGCASMSGLSTQASVQSAEINLIRALGGGFDETARSAAAAH